MRPILFAMKAHTVQDWTKMLAICRAAWHCVAICRAICRVAWQYGDMAICRTICRVIYRVLCGAICRSICSAICRAAWQYVAICIVTWRNGDMAICGSAHLLPRITWAGVGGRVLLKYYSRHIGAFIGTLRPRAPPVHFISCS